jgi:hypothetical protein
MLKTKQCYTCNIEQPVENFNKNSNKKDSLQYECKSCRKVYRSKPEKIIETAQRSKKHYESHKDRYRDRGLKKLYGISLKDYEKLYNSQEGVCKICGNFEDRLSVDHNHRTDKIRSLLCKNCNALLGHVDDSIQILKQAISYLEEYKEIV